MSTATSTVDDLDHPRATVARRHTWRLLERNRR